MRPGCTRFQSGCYNTFAVQPSELHQNSVLLRNVRIIQPDEIVDRADVLIQQDRIVRISSSPTEHPAKTDLELDLGGLTLFPGFIDIHIHGAAGVDTMDAGAEELAHVSEFLASRGVTAWLPTLVPAAPEQYEAAINAISESMVAPKWDRGRPVRSSLSARGRENTGDSPADLRAGRPRSRVLGVHYEGPFVNHEQCGALHREHFRAFTQPSDLDTLPTIKLPGNIHLMTLAPEVEGGIDLIRKLVDRNWIVSIGHTRATVELLDQALSAGARHMTHFMNAMTPLHHRSSGAVGWGLINDEVGIDLIADGVHINPSILKFIVRAKSPARVSLISDAIAAAGQGDGDYKIWGEEISVRDGRTANARGSIAGSVITALDALKMMLALGFSEIEVARMASHNPARLMRIDGDYGSIEAGKRADLVALDKDLNVQLTIIGGQIAHQS